MISTKTATPIVQPPESDEPRTGTPFTSDNAVVYCRNCKAYHPRDCFVDRGNGVLTCRRCHEALIGIEHEKKVRDWMRKIVTFYIDQEVENRKDTTSISSLTWAKSFYGEFRGPAECGAEIGAYFRDLMKEHPNSVGVAGKLVTLMRLLTQIESNHQAQEQMPTTREGLIAHMQALAMKAVNQAMRTEAAKSIAEAAQFMSDTMPIARISGNLEEIADSVAVERGLESTLGPLDVKPAFDE